MTDDLKFQLRLTLSDEYAQVAKAECLQAAARRQRHHRGTANECHGAATVTKSKTSAMSCSARASGHAAAPPSRVMNSRRLTRSPRRRAAGTAPGSRGRALSQS